MLTNRRREETEFSRKMVSEGEWLRMGVGEGRQGR